MAHPAAAAPPRDMQQVRNASSTPPTPMVTKSLVTRDFDLTLRAFFPTPTAPTKFNPIGTMNQLLRTMLKDEPSLVLQNPNNDKQLVLAMDHLPTSETGFKQFFKVSTTWVDKQNQTHVCIGCHVLSTRSLGSIKFKSKENHLLAWLKKARVFLESDSLGTERPMTIGYFTKIAPDFTHLTNFRNELVTQLSMVDIDAETAITLAPHLKQAQLEAMLNGDDYVPILPIFKVYRTKITHGREPSQVSTEVIGVKGAPRDAKLLGEFFTRMAEETSNDHRDGMFLPKGAVHLLGIATFEQILKDNNFFLTTVATIPVNLEFDAWFALLDANHTSETEAISLHDHLLRQPWFIRLESVTRNKTVIVTTKSNLSAARAWIDENLEPMIRKSIPSDVEQPPSSLLPHRLDKTIFTTTSRTYADILKQQFSLEPNANKTTNDHNKPPRKRQAAKLDYDLDQSTEFTATPTAPTTIHSTGTTTSNTTTPKTQISAFVKDMTSIKHELAQLKDVIATAVAQWEEAIAALLDAKSTTASPVTPPETDQLMDSDSAEHLTSLDLQTFISDLKHEIATLFLETHVMIQKQSMPTPTTKHSHLNT